MRQKWLARAGGAELTLVFGGWGLAAAQFAELGGGQDVLFVEDYRALDLELSEIASYDRFRLLAYSFGVAAAAHWLARTRHAPMRLVAVNGTLFPADPERGIPPEMVAATASELSEASFTRFCRRAGLMGPPPALDVEARRAELLAIIQRGAAPQTRFDRIWISTSDRIIPTHAQEMAWGHQAHEIRRLDAPHLPFQRGQSWEAWFA
jgi:biotin synthesis protein BioG